PPHITPLSLSRHPAHPDPHSFPTRRSSDLHVGVAPRAAPNESCHASLQPSPAITSSRSAAESYAADRLLVIAGEGCNEAWQLSFGAARGATPTWRSEERRVGKECGSGWAGWRERDKGVMCG